MAVEPKIVASNERIHRAKQERERLLRQIEESQNSINRSRELIARIDKVLAEAEHQPPKK
jgi:hypothetical protein